MPLLLSDLDDTLIDRAGAFERWARDFAARHDIGPEHLRWMLDVDNDGFISRPAYLAALQHRFGLGESVASLCAEYHAIYPSFVAPVTEETLGALHRLRTSGWRVGVVTNGAASQETKLAHAGLIGHLDGWAVSEMVGCAKPDPGIFQAAAERCGVALEGAWMVGDHGPADIAGASALGLRSVWLHRNRTWPFTGYRPTHTAGSFAGAVDLILAEAAAPGAGSAAE